MLTIEDLRGAILAPVVVALIVAGVGRWRRWAWAMPAAAGAGFLAGYALVVIPKLPPRDGTDWLFWLAVPLILLGVIDAVVGRGWGWLLGAAAGGAALLILHPLVPGGLTPAVWWCTAGTLAVAGAILSLIVKFAETRITSAAAVAGLCVTTGGAAIVVLSSNLRIVGVYGIGAAAALGPVAVLIGPVRAARSVAIVSISLLVGLLVAGRFYPDPGVAWTNFVVLAASPALLFVGAVVPGKRNWLRGLIAVGAVSAAVMAVTIPTALAAKKAAESDSYDAAGAPSTSWLHHASALLPTGCRS